MGRAARGVTGIRFEGDDKVVGLAVIPKVSDEAPTEGKEEPHAPHRVRKRLRQTNSCVGVPLAESWW
jgi:DNA gyrase/topoisomerase IV subunit A